MVNWCPRPTPRKPALLLARLSYYLLCIGSSCFDERAAVGSQHLKLSETLHFSNTYFSKGQQNDFNQVFSAIVPCDRAFSPFDTISLSSKDLHQMLVLPPSTPLFSRFLPLYLHFIVHILVCHLFPAPSSQSELKESAILLIQEPYKALYSFQSKIYIAISTSAGAPPLHHGGQTVHSTFEIPNRSSSSDLCIVSSKIQQPTDLQNVDFIILEEVVTCACYSISAVDCTKWALSWMRTSFIENLLLFFGYF